MTLSSIPNITPNPINIFSATEIREYKEQVNWLDVKMIYYSIFLSLVIFEVK